MSRTIFGHSSHLRLESRETKPPFRDSLVRRKHLSAHGSPSLARLVRRKRLSAHGSPPLACHARRKRLSAHGSPPLTCLVRRMRLSAHGSPRWPAKRAESLCSEFWLRAKFRLEASRSFHALGPSMFLRFDKPRNSKVSEPIGLNNQRNSATGGAGEATTFFPATICRRDRGCGRCGSSDPLRDRRMKCSLSC